MHPLVKLKAEALTLAGNGLPLEESCHEIRFFLGLRSSSLSYNVGVQRVEDTPYYELEAIGCEPFIFAAIHANSSGT